MTADEKRKEEGEERNRGGIWRPRKREKGRKI